MPPKDYRTPLQTATGVSVVTPGGGPATVGYTNPAFDQQRQFGPKLAEAAKNYPGALQAAREAQMKAYDNSEGIYGEYNERLSQPGKNQMWGRFGAALLQPTSTGSFFEGFGKAANAAMDERDRYNDKEAERMDKLTRSRLALEELHANKPNAQIGVIEDQMKAYELSGKVGGILADADLTPQDDEALLADYAANPRKYAGAGGQQMVASAQARQAKIAERQWELGKMDYQSQLKREEEAAKANQPPNLTSVDKKAFLDAKNTKAQMTYALSNLDKAMELGPNSLTGPATGLRARVGDWFGDDQSAAHLQYQQIMEGEAIKQMAETLKGATTDREMQKFIDIVADPGASWDVKKPAIERVKAFVEMQIAESEDTMQGIGNGTIYRGGQGAAPQGGQGGAQQPDPKQVMGKGPDGQEILWEDIVHTAEQNGMTVEQVIQKLNGE